MAMNSYKRKLFFRAWIILCMLLNAVTPQNIDVDNLSTCEIESLLKQIYNPGPEYQMHAASLRNQLRNLLENEQFDDYQTALENGLGSDYFDQDKRSLSSLAREGLIRNGKRYVGALARTGMLRNSIEDYKRSLATLAKNGQLPSREPDVDGNTSSQWEEKRNLGSLAKSGYMYSGKRNVGSLARDYQLPAGKRNLAALARLGFIPSTTPKRNLASIARFNSYPSKREVHYSKDIAIADASGGNAVPAAEKRNIGALKNSPVHGTRQKRDLYSGLEDNLEVPDQVFQPLDYEEIKDNWERLYGPYYGDNIQEGKRFLGRILPPTRASTTTHRSRL